MAPLDRFPRRGRKKPFLRNPRDFKIRKNRFRRSEWIPLLRRPRLDARNPNRRDGDPRMAVDGRFSPSRFLLSKPLPSRKNSPETGNKTAFSSHLRRTAKKMEP